jgi:hypothetical protein
MYIYIGRVISCAVCPVCNASMKEYLYVGFFSVLPQEKQLTDMFKNSNMCELIQYPSPRHKSNKEKIEDVFDGFIL